MDPKEQGKATPPQAGSGYRKLGLRGYHQRHCTPKPPRILSQTKNEILVLSGGGTHTPSITCYRPDTLTDQQRQELAALGLNLDNPFSKEKPNDGPSTSLSSPSPEQPNPPVRHKK